MGCGRLGRAPMLGLGEELRKDEVLRIAGDLGGVTPPAPCRELKDARLCKVEVEEGSLPPRDPELGDLLKAILPT